MATHRPLILDSGVLRQLPAGTRLQGFVHEDELPDLILGLLASRCGLGDAFGDALILHKPAGCGVADVFATPLHLSPGDDVQDAFSANLGVFTDTGGWLDTFGVQLPGCSPGVDTGLVDTFGKPVNPALGDDVHDAFDDSLGVFAGVGYWSDAFGTGFL